MYLVQLKYEQYEQLFTRAITREVQTPPDVSVWGGLRVPTDFWGLKLNIGNFPRGLQCCVSGDRKHDEQR